MELRLSNDLGMGRKTKTKQSNKNGNTYDETGIYGKKKKQLMKDLFIVLHMQKRAIGGQSEKRSSHQIFCTYKKRKYL